MTPPPPRDGGEHFGRFLYEKMSSPPRDDRWEDLSEMRRALWCAAADSLVRKVLRERDAAQAELLDAARDALSALAVIDHVAHFYRGRLPKRARETLFDALTCAAWGDLRAAVAAAERTGEPPMR
jgi:hypothetical protein